MSELSDKQFHTVLDLLKQHKKSECQFECVFLFFFFIYTIFYFIHYKAFSFFFLTSCFPEYNTSLNVVYNLIPLHIVPVRFIYTLIVFICMISLKYITIYLVYRVQSLYCLIFFHYFPNKPTFICISVSFFLRL